MSNRNRLFTALALVAVAFMAAACTGGGGGTGYTAPSGGSTATTPSGGGTAGGNAVTISNFAFSPSDLSAPVGTKVTWTNQDSVAHTVTSSDGSFKSGQLAPGGTFSFTFTKAGVFTYHCSNHPRMLGQVTVK
jgi:plastocyanin